ncbi:MAG: nucleoside recognition domain-containing protein [Peptococcaceae bacterium]|jgi:spore maturation protein A|nr:spore maturation protein [Peptococcaceae bacterium]MDH7525931.1 nucleoside recognition domain-containing protein [Peptococcaceae bacterium]
MINLIWAAMILSGIIMAAVKGKPEVITQSAFQSAQAAVKYSLELAGIMSFWLGMMRIAEEAGLVAAFARVLRPLMRLLFPSVPPQHPAVGAMVMNLSANILGLGNAATPFGLKAMQELQSINPAKERASPAMCTFLAINTACITLMPTMIIGIRAAAGSADPTEIVGTTFLATAAGMCAAVLADGVLRMIYGRR